MMLPIRGFLFLLLLLLYGVKSQNAVKCLPRDYGFGGTVCVCNAEHCDTVEPMGSFSSNEYNVYLSSQSGLRLQYTKGNFEARDTKGGIEIQVDPNTKYQKIYGFGGAFTDAAGINIKSLDSKAQEKLLASYFSPEGIEYNFGRVPIGGTDFSVRKYSLDDVPDDVTLEKFSLSQEDFDYKIPFITEAVKLSKKKINLIGTAWSSPPWMKSNGDYTCFGMLKREFYDLWAQYHIRFLEEYAKKGLNFWGISTGNEPIAGLLPYPFNCLGWTPSTQSVWVSQYLGPRLVSSSFNKTLIIAIDDQRFTLPWWPMIMFKNKETDAYVAGIGLHWYWDKFLPPKVLDWTYELYPNKFILLTEACFMKEKGNTPTVHLGSWDRGETYADSIITNLNHYAGGWIDWNLALDLEGGPNWVKNFVDSPVIVNASAGEFYKQPMFYTLGHFSKFIPEGSVRIQTSQTASSSLCSIGFLTPANNIVIVLLNKSEKSTDVNVYGHPKAVASIHMPGKSIATLIYKS